MKRWLSIGAALLALAVPMAAHAQDSNTLHKIGKAIQYPVNKAGQNTSKTAHKAAKATQYPVNKTGQNTSITAHKATGQNSVTTVKPTHHKVVVTPAGIKKPVMP
jgi:uncharacterized membrane protein